MDRLERELVREVHTIREKNGYTEDIAFIKYALSERLEKAKKEVFKEIDKMDL